MRIIENILSQKNIHKAIAIVLGIGAWYIWGQSQQISRWIKIPIYFYELPTTLDIKAPESIAVKLSGNRSNFYQLNRETIALHINSSQLKEGTYALDPSNYQIFLPEPLKMVDYQLEHFTVTIKS